ncbi:two-partner secretion system transporter CdrB [soil metagenome]
MRSFKAVVACGVLVSAGSSLAQTVVPGGAQPGQIEPPFQRAPEPRPSLAPDVNLGPQALPPEQARALRFKLSDVSIEGTTVMGANRLAALTAPLIGNEVSLADIYELADRVTALYRNDGYVLTRVLVPQQRIADGKVRLVAVEGYVDKVVLQGTIPGRSDLLQAYADRIKAERPLTAATLERYLLLMNDLGGAAAQATLRASPDTRGAADLIIDFSVRSVEAYAELNNRGSRALGPGRVEAELDIHSPLKLFDTVRLSAATTANDELRFVNLGYELPLGNDGLLASVNGSVARTHPQLGAGVEVRTESNAAQFRLLYPVKRSRAENLYARATLAWINGETEVAGLPLTNDHVRTARVGLAYDLADRWLGVNFVDVELVQGLNVGGATQTDAADSSRLGASPTFFKAAFYAARVQSLMPQFELLAAASGQYAPKKLFPSEQFAFGGNSFGRAYDSAELLGDYGGALKFELRYLGRSRGLDASAYTVYLFHDIGKVWLRDPANQAGKASAASVGAGVRFNAFGQASGYVELAKPLTRNVALEGNRDARVFAALRWTFR